MKVVCRLIQCFVHQCKAPAQPGVRSCQRLRSVSHITQAVRPTCCFMVSKRNSCLQLLIILSHVKSTAFETYGVPDEVYLSRFSLAGLGKQMWPTASPVEELLMDPCLPLSPLKMPRGNGCIYKCSLKWSMKIFIPSESFLSCSSGIRWWNGGIPTDDQWADRWLAPWVWTLNFHVDCELSTFFK